MADGGARAGGREDAKDRIRPIRQFWEMTRTDNGFYAECSELGWIDGRNISFEFRNDGDDYRAAAPAINDLVRSKVEMIVVGGTAAVLAAQGSDSYHSDHLHGGERPAGQRDHPDLARPGGNITGLSALSVELTAKRLELLKGNPAAGRHSRDSRELRTIRPIPCD